MTIDDTNPAPNTWDLRKYLRNEGRLDGCYGIMTCAVESDIWLCSTIVLHNQMSVNRARHNAITPIQTTLITYIYIHLLFLCIIHASSYKKHAF